jgi:hypothetical protein
VSDNEAVRPCSVLAIACVLLQKQDGTALTTSMTQHWRVGIDDENQMRGIAVAEALKMRPGMAVADVLTAIIRIPNLPTKD